MPGNHKRIRKARAKKAEEKRRSSSDQTPSSRKSSVTDECISFGAVGWASFETESSADSSPLKCDDDFNTGPFRDYVMPVVGSIKLNVEDTNVSLNIDNTVQLNDTSQHDKDDSCLQVTNNTFGLGDGQDNPRCEIHEMGNSSSSQVSSKNDRSSKIGIMSQEECQTPGTVDISHEHHSRSFTIDVNKDKHHLIQTETTKTKDNIKTCSDLTTIDSSRLLTPSVSQVPGGTSVDPPTYEQREIPFRCIAVQVKSVPSEGQGLVSLEEAPILKYRVTSSSTELPSYDPHIPAMKKNDENIITDRPFDDTLDLCSDAITLYAVRKSETNQWAETRVGDLSVDGKGCTDSADDIVENTRKEDNFLPEAMSSENLREVMENSVAITNHDKNRKYDVIEINAVSNQSHTGSKDTHLQLAAHPTVNDTFEFEIFGFSLGQSVTLSGEGLPTNHEIEKKLNQGETTAGAAGLSADISEQTYSLNPDQVDLVTSYIDQLFEACLDPETPENEATDLSTNYETNEPNIQDVIDNSNELVSSELGLDVRLDGTDRGIEDTKQPEIKHVKPIGIQYNERKHCDYKFDITTKNKFGIVSKGPETRRDDKSKPILSIPSSNANSSHHLHSSNVVDKEFVLDLSSKHGSHCAWIRRKDKSEYHVFTGSFEDSNPVGNLPDVVSSSTWVSRKEGFRNLSNGVAMSRETHWQACLIYLSQVYNIYKLLEALYISMCAAFQDSALITEPDITSRVILMCKGSRLTGAAIQSLDSLNDQIVQYIFAQNNVDLDLEKDLSPRDRETLKSSMVLIRGLLIDAQSKFRKMVDDNRQLAVKIDGSIQAANQEVNVLRAELADTNKRLSQITLTNDLKVDKATQSDTENSLRHKSDEENELTKMKEENVRLEVQVKALTREVQELKLVKAASSEQPSYGELKLELIQTRQEVNRAKEALQAMKADRKRLKGEKLDLLNQMKQLYTTLEDKESELRDFIRNYEQRVRESDETIKQLAMEKEECEREKWRIIKKAQEAAERAVVLRSQCDTKDQALKKLEVELAELRMQPDHNKSGLSAADQTSHSITSTIASEEVPPYETPSQSDVSRDDSFSVKTSTPSHDSRLNSLTNTNKILNTSHEFTEHESKKKHRIPVFGSLTRMFSKGRLRRSLALPHGETFDDPGLPKLALLNDDNYQEKLQIVTRLKGVHMSNWKANQVLAWLEISLSMSMYAKMCAENIKSGKVLLGLSDSDLSSALGITNNIHRRKLRLAIEEQRDPGEIKYCKAANIDHTWVSHLWLPDLGLAQHSAVFEAQLADGRLLNQLSKKDLEKHFNVHRKFHQASILHGVELLRLLNFDKELLSERRTQCEDTNTDPLVWTNERVIKWIKSIELGEYVLNLKESGVHGALMVLEPSFTADTLATALGIPPSKSYLRRHIATELETLIKPARAALDTPNNNTKMRINGTGSVGRSFIRSYRSSSLDDGGPKGRLSFRGSLGRAFGRKIKDDLRMNFDSDSTPKSRRGLKISEPIPIQHNHSLDSIVEPDSTTV